MPCDYKKICQDNIRRRGDEFDDIGHLISEQLYSDRAHFVYELLQNAEDALERRLKERPDDGSRCRVRFRLFQDRLEFRHFGVPFNEEDVKGISDVLKGTKKEDPVQIGKFGIGFKSVYAFTASPEIHSGGEHFVIKRYIRPEGKELPPDLSIVPDETVFIFPFDHKDLSANHAFDLILNKLQRLGPRVLLFLKRIDEIEWSIESNGEEGHYLKEIQRENESMCRITVIGQKSGQDKEENWLLFDRSVTVANESYEVSVEAGFWLEVDTKNKMERIAKINDTELVVYFPTDKATRLGFLIQGPYRTNPARDNIPEDDDWNKMLVEETAKLVAESLESLRGMGLLSVSLLEALPIRTEDFQEDSMFYPIFSRVSEALMTQELLPANDGTFIAARNAKLARGEELRRLLNQDQLRPLFQSDADLKWLSASVTQDRTPDLRRYLMGKLKVDEIAPEVFARHLSEQFLALQDDEWFVRFYKFLSEQKTLWRQPRWRGETEGILRNKPILRLQDGSHVAPFQNSTLPNAYLAGKTDTETLLPIVKVSLSSDDGARKFLKDLGIPELDIVEEVLGKILPKYTDASATVDAEESERDLKKIERAYSTDSQDKKRRLRSALRNTPFILAECLNEGETAYRKPNQVYFSSDELRMYFAKNNSFTCVTTNHPYAELLRKLGVEESIRIRREPGDSKRRVTILSYRGWHKRGLDGFDPNIHVDGLECALSTPCLEKSTFIWNKIAVPNSDCIRGVVERSTRQTYESSEEEKQISEFGELLTDNAWLPDLNGHWHKPSELTLDDLPRTFVRDEKLAAQLGMKKNVVAKLAEEAGISQTSLDRARRFEEAPPEIQQRIDLLLREEKNKKTLQQEGRPYDEALSNAFSAPGKKGANHNGGDGGFSSNPSRRREKTSKDIAAAIKNKSDPGERSYFSVRKNWESKNDQVRADFAEWYGGRCQICGQTFTQRNGEPYFEGLYLVSRTTADWIDRVGNVLCLCAQHSAMFQFGLKEAEDIIQQVMQLKAKAEGGDGYPAIRMKLCGEPIEIKFAEKHLIDLQEMIRTAQESGA